MRRTAVGTAVTLALAAGSLTLAPASQAAETLPELQVIGLGSAEYPLNLPAPAVLYPGLGVKIAGNAITWGVPGNFEVTGQKVTYGYVTSKNTCSGSGTTSRSIVGATTASFTITLPEAFNGVSPEAGSYFCVQRSAEGTGNANQGTLYSTTPQYFPMGQANPLAPTAPIIVPPGGANYVTPSTEFTVLVPNASPNAQLLTGQVITTRKLQFGRAASVGGVCSVYSTIDIAPNASFTSTRKSQPDNSGYMCVRQVISSNMYPATVNSAFKYVEAKPTPPVAPPAPGQAPAQSTARPDLPEILIAQPAIAGGGGSVMGQANTPYLIRATMSGNIVGNELTERMLYVGYSPNTSRCATATSTDLPLNTDPATVDGIFDAGQVGNYLCTYQAITLAGQVYASNVLYQQIVPAAATVAAPPVLGTPPPTVGSADPIQGTQPVVIGGGSNGAGQEGSTPGTAKSVSVGEVLTVATATGSTKAGTNTISVKANAKARRGAKLPVKFTVKPKAAGTVTYVLTTATKNARVIKVLGTSTVKSSGTASRKVTIPTKGTKKGKRYYLVAIYTAPDGSQSQVARKITTR